MKKILLFLLLSTAIYGQNQSRLASLGTANATLTGTPTAPTAAPGTTGNQVATLDYVLAVDANAVHKTGVESISGDKTFNATISVVNPLNTEQTVIAENGTLKITTSDLEAQSTIDASLLTTSRSHKLPDASGTIALVETVRPYKVYTALLSQSGTSAPTANVLENTLGGTIVWSYSSAGVYHGTLTGAFLVNKSIAFVTGIGFNKFIGCQRLNDNVMQITSVDTANSPADTTLISTAIEIRVYN